MASARRADHRPVTGADIKQLERRKNAIEAARKRNPNRWSGNIRNCEPAPPVTLNPGRAANYINQSCDNYPETCRLRASTEELMTFAAR